MSLSQGARLLLGVCLPVAWLYHGPAVLRYAPLPDFAGLVAVSILATIVLSLAFWLFIVACAWPLRFVLPRSVRESAVLLVFVLLLSILGTVSVLAWLSDFGLAVPRVILVPLICVACAAAAVLRPVLVENTIAEMIGNAWRLMRIPIYAFALAGVCCIVVASITGHSVGSAPAAAASSSRTSRPSILLITIDAFSAERSDLYGAAQVTTPSLAEFAKQATVFDFEVAATNYTASAFATIHTGQYPWTHRVLQHQGYFLPAPDTLASSLHRAGYRTAYFDANWLADPRHTLSRGGWDITTGPYDAAPIPDARSLCDLAVCDTSRLASIPPLAQVYAVYEYCVRRLGLFERVRYPPDPILADARAWIASNTDSQPVFVWIHLFPPHDPYLPPAPFLHSLLPARTLDTADGLMTQPLHFFAPWDPARIHELESRYKESLRYVDDRVGRFLRDPLIAGLAGRSIVVITSDHGESFERNFVGHTGPLLTHSLVRVPLIIRAPGMSTSSRMATPVSETDVMPTILDLAGVAIPSSVEGISLKPFMDGAPAPPRMIYSMNFEYAVAHSPLLAQRHSVALVDWPWKYVEYKGTPQMPRELYNLALDPAEKSNLASAQRQAADRYSTIINRAIAASDARERK